MIWRFPPNQRSADQLAAKPLSLPKLGRNSPPTGMKTETNTIVVIGLPWYTAEEICRTKTRQPAKVDFQTGNGVAGNLFPVIFSEDEKYLGRDRCN